MWLYGEEEEKRLEALWKQLQDRETIALAMAVRLHQDAVQKK